MNRHILKITFTIIIISGIAILLSASSIGLQAERVIYDTNTLYLSYSPPPSDIMIVSIDDNTFDLVSEEMNGLHWPYPRSFHAKVLNHLSEAGAKAVFLDIIFDIPSGFGEEDDFSLEESIIKIPTVLAGEFSDTKIIPPLSCFMDHGAFAGNVSVPVDIDHCIRNMHNSRTLPSGFREALSWFCFGIFNDFPLKSSYHEPIPTVEQALFAITHPDEEPPEPGFINYFGPSGSIPSVSWFEIFQPELFAIKKELLKDKVVFIGKTSSASITPDRQSDMFSIPWGHEMMPGVEIRASAYASLTAGKIKYLISPVIFPFMFIGWVFLFSLTMINIHAPLKSFLALIGFLIVLVTINMALFYYHLITPFMPFLFFSITFYVFILGKRYLQERDRHLLTRAQLFHYIPERVARHVMENPAQLAMAGDRATITLLFADIAGFTTLLETLPPESIIPMLKEHLKVMTKAIFDHQGTLDKYLGDGIMAFWGAPEHQENHADLALKAAMEMLRLLDDANRKRKKQGMTELHMRIGLHTGEAVVGNIGSELFIDYTAIGDNVNTASRVKGVSQYFDVRISISGECINALTEEIPDTVFPMARVAVKGKKEPINLYTISHKLFVDAYNALYEYLNLLDRHEFEQAKVKLNKILENYPGFGPACFHYSKFMSHKTPLLNDTDQPYWRLESK
ncbi:MAG: adenylate/guanylate cyclase domain-containing protein [Proteobacteria bacterium]|nr:adenylate/guanylate cyclase domain-containing protein [Pseudomonadota bacterium]